MKNLKAFTLMELLIGMIVSCIVIGFGYGAYSLIYKQFLSYKKMKEETMEVAQFKSVMSNDIFAADQLCKEDNKIVLKQEKMNLLYEFDNSFILRKVNGLTDTFKISTSDINPVYTFENRENNELISSFFFSANVLNEDEVFNFSKEYSAKTLMESEANTGN
ncbi:MAG: prepilin-type N-terminal cleavage/methylation domain-containing protein [Bacteroidia bacterium]